MVACNLLLAGLSLIRPLPGFLIQLAPANVALVLAVAFSAHQNLELQKRWVRKRLALIEKERALHRHQQATGQENKSLEETLARLAGLYELTKQLLFTLDRNEAVRNLSDILIATFPRAAFRLCFISLDPAASSVLERVLELRQAGAREIAVQSSDRWLLDRMLPHGAVWSAWPMVGVADTATLDIPPDLKTATAFPLRMEDRLHGFLVVKDLMPEDLDRCGILVSQFALAVRRIRLYERVQELAIRDGLTGLLVRRHFVMRLQEEAARAARQELPLSFLMVDIDRFKEINDRHGHLVGDAVLRELAALLRTQVRDVDLLGRYGGEEFGLGLPEADTAQAQMAAGRIRQAVQNAGFRAYDEHLSITVSIGVSALPRDAADATELIEHADAAMYKAKMEGRNRVCVFGV